MLTDIRTRIGEYPSLQALLNQAICEQPPVTLRDGGVIAEGYDPELDELRRLSQGASDYLSDLEERERQRTGISSLKVGYNRVQGFYIETSRASSHQVPSEYIRRQTLKNTERYITPELKAHEDKVLNSQSRALALEKQRYEELFDIFLPHLGTLTASTAALAELDVLCCLSERAATLGLSRPHLVDTPTLTYQDGRHLVVEQSMKDPFIANDLALDNNTRMLMITGPNMGGKSTYMRQTALIVLLAHIGSFVPAKNCHIGPIDRIFTRIGASDDLSSGRSTFMVEMTETANILHHATAKSLVLMDEIGRGTSTYDGLSLAWAVATRLAQSTKCFCLFATHYFELTALPEQIDGIANVQVTAVEHRDNIRFMHRVEKGAANRSFGLQVAKLAGVPVDVLREARQKLKTLEADALPPPAINERQVPLPLVPECSASDALLDTVQPDELSPREALELVYQLKALRKQSAH